MTIRDARTGTYYDVDDDGKRISIEVVVDATHSDDCDGCECEAYATETLSFDKTELLELLKGR